MAAQDNKKPAAVEAVPESVVNRDARRFNREARWVLPGFTFLVIAVLYMWYLWEPSYLEHDEDLVYDLGLIGGLAMLFQFAYTARKRLKSMRQWGNLKLWFVIHMISGIIGPLIVIVHSRFMIESINGGVAFFAMLLVVFSGVVGRYLYAQMNFDIAARRQQLVKLQQGLQRTVLDTRSSEAAGYISNELKQYAIQAMRKQAHPVMALMNAVIVPVQGYFLYWRLAQSPAMTQGRTNEAMVMTGAEGLSASESRILKAYLQALADLAKFNALGQLFALWRVGHVPVIYLLLITGLAHVLAVHMY